LVRARLQKLALLALGLVLGILLAELGLRALAQFHAPVRYLVTMGAAPERPVFESLEAYLASQAPHVAPHHDVLNYWTNALGLNDLEFVVPKPAGRFRILALGDSFTYGHVPYPDAVMTRLEDALRAGCPRVDLDLLNFGIGGMGVWDYKTVVELGAERFDPDLVLVNFYMGNDGPDLYVRPRASARRRLWVWRSYLVRYVQNTMTLATGLERELRATAPNPRPAGSPGAQGGMVVDPRNPLRPDDSRLVGPTFTGEKFLEIMWDELRRFSRQSEVHDPERAWQPTLTMLDLLRHEVTRRGRRLVITLYPSVLQVHSDKRAELLKEIQAQPRAAGLLPVHVDPQLPGRILLEYCRRVGIDCLDVTPDLIVASLESAEALYKQRDTHWTVRGNLVVAETQARWLRPIVCP
jgi:hypothetical protein